MEFNKAMVYTAVNADELKEGDKVLVADSLAELRSRVTKNNEPKELKIIKPDSYSSRFEVEGILYNFSLAYLVERKENCTNCDCCVCAERNWATDLGNERIYCCPRYHKPNTEEKAEPHYRPFRDTDELIAHWLEIGGKWQKRELTMPFIWVRNKSDRKVWLIHDFDKRILGYLFTNCEFLDGSPCGVEVKE